MIYTCIHTADKLDMGRYININCEGTLKYLGLGYPSMLRKAWEKIQAEDMELCSSKQHSHRLELLERRQRFYEKVLKLSASMELIQNDLPTGRTLLEVMRIVSEGDTTDKALLKASTSLKGAMGELNRIDDELRTDPVKKPTKKDYYKELAVLNKLGYNVTLKTSLAEYRGAYNSALEQVQNGKAGDN